MAIGSLRRLAFASSIGAGVALSVLHRPALCRDVGLESLAARVAALEAAARGSAGVMAERPLAQLIDGKSVAAQIRAEVP